MHFFRVMVRGQHVKWHTTLAAAHKHAREGSSDRFDIEIRLEDVPSDKAAIAAFLNGEAEQYIENMGPPPLRIWGITPRGGLKEDTQ